MSIVDPAYTPDGGVYVSVVPVVPPPLYSCDSPGFEAATDHHVTVVHDADARIEAGLLEEFFARNNITPATTFKAYAVSPSVWVNGDKAYVGVEFFSLELFSLHEKMKAELGIISTFKDYKCHMTLGKFRGLSADQLADIAALRAMTNPDYLLPTEVLFAGVKLVTVKA